MLVTVVSFVVYFSPAQRGSGGGRTAEVDFGSIDGKKVTPAEYNRALIGAQFEYWLARGEWPERDPRARQAGFDTRREAYRRLLLLRRAEALGIQVGTEQVAREVRSLFLHLGRGEMIDPEKFEAMVLRPAGLTLDSLAGFVRDNLLIQQLAQVVSLPGALLTTNELRDLYVYENQQVRVEVIPFLASNYLDKVRVDLAALQEYYSNHLDRYTLPERVRVRYVKFELTNYLGRADELLAGYQDLSNQLEHAYAQLSQEQKASGSPEELKARLRENFRRRTALELAWRAANAFGRVVFDQEPLRLESLLRVAEWSNMVVRVSPDMSLQSFPEGLNVDGEFVKAAFGLSQQQPVSEPVVQHDGVYIMALDRFIPAELQPFEAVRAQVERDYRWTQAAKLAQQAGEKFHATLTNELARGRALQEICAAHGVRPLAPAPFARSTQVIPEIDELLPTQLVRDAAFRVVPGRCSGFIPTTLGGFIVYVKERLPVDESKLRAEWDRFATTLVQVARNEAFQAWFRHAAQSGLADTPVGRLDTNALAELPER